jgi:hypothetical protein
MHWFYECFYQYHQLLKFLLDCGLKIYLLGLSVEFFFKWDYPHSHHFNVSQTVCYHIEYQINWLILSLSLMCVRALLIPLKSFIHVMVRGSIKSFLPLIQFILLLIFPCIRSFISLFILFITHYGFHKYLIQRFRIIKFNFVFIRLW